MCVWRACIAEVVAAEVACVAGASRLRVVAKRLRVVALGLQ